MFKTFRVASRPSPSRPVTAGVKLPAVCTLIGKRGDPSMHFVTEERHFLTAKKKTGTLKKNLVANEISLSAEGARAPSLILSRFFFFFFLTTMLPKENSRNTKTETNLDLWERPDTRWGFQEQVFWFVTFFFPKVTNPRVAHEVTCREETSESYVLTQRKGRRRREQMKKERSPWRCVLERTRFFSLFSFSIDWQRNVLQGGRLQGLRTNFE